MPGGAPRTRTLTREKIFEAALALVDESFSVDHPELVEAIV